MKRIRIGSFAAMLGLVAGGCDNFLTGNEELTVDPNRPLTAEASQLFLAVQTAEWAFQTGQWARLVCMWMQQCAGTDRQYQSLGVYEIAEATFDGAFGDVYGAGGLVDIKKIKVDARQQNNLRLVGMTQVLEALRVGTAADLFGDVPYSEAAAPLEGGAPSVTTPKLDEQLAVYAALQVLLDSAIANLAGAGPGAVGGRDFVYGSNASKWTQLAWTLKARYYLHTGEVAPTAYANALAAARRGISSRANNYTTRHTGDAGESNLWYQFIEEQRQGYIAPGAFLVDTILEARNVNDPRLEEYFDRPKGATTFRGAVPGEAFTPALSLFDTLVRAAPDFSQPIVTYEENTLIWAEAAFRTGDQVTALAKLNEVRATDGLPALVLAGPALLHEILIEKYIQLFQTIEVYNDWRRTCTPNITPALGASEIPRRFLYPASERNANPNIPPPDQQPKRNDNDPRNATDVLGAACRGQNSP